MDAGPETREERERFSATASLDSILDALSRAQAERQRIESQVAWLEVLLIRRARQVADDTWKEGSSDAERAR